MDAFTNIAELIKSVNKHAEELRKHPSHEEKIEYKCPKCKDTGLISGMLDEDHTCSMICDCQKARQAERLMEQSGLGKALKEQTFDSYITTGPEGENIKATARRYADALIHPGNTGGKKPWLFVGGNPGAGKSHICTAVCRELLNNNIPVRYMQWNEEARRFKAYINSPELDDLLEPYLDIPVLYIDDLFKCASGRLSCTDSDIRLAFSILNTRYLRDLPTIISCEWELLKDLMPVDEGLFSRVLERAKGYVIRIPRDVKYNFRIWQKGC